MAADPDLAERCAVVGRAVHGDGDLDGAVPVLRGLPAALPVRGALAAGLVDRMLGQDGRAGPGAWRHVGLLFEIADRNPPTDGRAADRGGDRRDGGPRRPPGRSAADRALYLAAGAVASFAPEAGREQVEAGLARVREALRLSGQDDPQRPFYLGNLALGLFRRNELGGPFAEVQEAAAALDEARVLAGGPSHPQWSAISEMLVDARRRLPGHTGSVESAVAGMRGYLWRVLVQPDLTAAKAAVRDAARDAVDRR